MSRYKPYSTRKDSGVQWLGDVPGHWTVSRLSAISTCNDDVVSERAIGNEPIRYVDISSVSGREGIHTTETMLFREAPSRARRKAREGDVIVSTVRTYLKAVAPVSEEYADCVFSTGFAVLRANDKCSSGFLRWAALNEGLVQAVEAHSSGVSYPAINATDLHKLKTAMPPLAEQGAIAATLDRETARIDALIAKKTRFIELLKEKRQALITNAVTKGLDPEVKMKDSGVEWIGLVPEHWVLLPLCRILQDRREKNDPIKTDAILSLSIAQGVVPHSEKIGVGGNKPKDDLTAYNIAHPNDLVLNSMNVIVGAVGMCRYFGAISPVYYALYPRKKSALIDYYAEIFQSQKFQEVLAGLGNGIMVKKSDSSGKLNTIRMKISMDTLGSQLLPLPPPEEQACIVKALSTHGEKTSRLIRLTETSIQLLKERRSALITAAVTGQIDLREAA